jgi:hypothetical protein
MSVDGDSITAIGEGGLLRPGQEYAAVAAGTSYVDCPRLFRQNISYTNFGVAGDTMTDRLSAIGTTAVPLLQAAVAAKELPIAHCWAGHNDFLQGHSIAELIADTLAYFATAASAGAQFCIGSTVYPTSALVLDGPNAGQPITNFSNPFNDWMRANFERQSTSQCQYILSDPAADPQLQVPTNTQIYLDGTHPTVFGAVMVATLFGWSVMQPLGGGQVTSVDVPAGPLAGGTTVNIFGSGFTGAQMVCFHTLRAASFTVIGDQHVQAVTPPGFYAGLGNVYVFAPNGSARGLNLWSFF